PLHNCSASLAQPGPAKKRERNLLRANSMRAYRVATLLGASGLALSALVFGPSFGCGQEPGSACVTDQDCRSHEACANASCVALDCPANRRWVTDSDRGRVCSECRDSTDCAEGQSCV